MITQSDATYLETVKDRPFAPLGWLYESVFRDLSLRGLVKLSADGYVISDAGKAELEEFSKHSR